MEHVYKNIFGYFDFEGIYSAAVKIAPPRAHFVEVGAFWGQSVAFLAVEAINSGKTILIDAVDIWGTVPESMYDSISSDKDEAKRREAARIIREHRGNMKAIFDSNLKRFGLSGFVNPIQSFSLDAARLYPNASLDFVFIDANHECDSVLADIRAWWKKVKPTGILAGHDFDISTPGVAQALSASLAGFDRIWDDGSVLLHRGSWVVCKGGKNSLAEFLHMLSKSGF